MSIDKIYVRTLSMHARMSDDFVDMFKLHCALRYTPTFNHAHHKQIYIYIDFTYLNTLVNNKSNHKKNMLQRANLNH